jgi:hypothetical protein
MGQIRFPSLAEPDRIAYTLESDSMALWDSRRHGLHLADWAGEYLTYGDGMTQHAPLCAAAAERFGDYCASLATYILEDPNGREALAQLDKAGYWPRYRMPSTPRIMFAHGLRHKDREDGKTVRYNVDDCKTSMAESKRHDRRWEDVPHWANGTLNSTLSLLKQFEGRPGVIELYAVADQVRDKIAEITGDWQEQTLVAIGVVKEEDRYEFPECYRHADYGFRALARLVAGYGAEDDARKTLGCYRHNTGLNDQPEPTETATA